ncbi:hypothetical protein GA0061098_1015109 [Bradyrhizobium shewense]|uniref:Phage terminase-like protein, large subunit, contains N-terminal HTH domain n=1 Tax=Bradyrhizobium shewense TaxID=1761772 RepID=A0A1C3XG20_9BRAD|nr:hypothetical protein [Bradyrhizobium shewense]SCB51222.1 hypothetical protein GA0061098_1015109 [Bradyrhizobium shewense]
MKQRLVRERLDARPAPRLKPQPRSNRLTLLDAIADPKLFKPFFKNPASWIAWRAFIAAAFGLPMSGEELVIYRACTGRKDAPTQQMRELVLVIGRRGGKSRILALIAVWLACFHDYRQYLDEGELGVVQVLAADKEQARVILRYVKGFIKKVPMLARMIERDTNVGLELSNSISIEITTSSYRAVRGRTVVAALCDEIAFWQSDDSANPDAEVVNAIKPGMATIPTSMLLLASSPYARRGVLYNMHRQYHGKDDPRVLSWQAATDVMNPEIDPAFLAQAFEDDAVSASAEYGAQFRSDVEAFIAREAVEAVTSDERERPYMPEFKYRAFADAAGGSGSDSFTLAIGHVEKGTSVLDVIREAKPPFSPETIVEQYSTLLKSYGIANLSGDRYAGEWAREKFLGHGITFEHSAKPKSAIYSEFLPLMMSKKCDLLDSQRLINQLCGLERRTARSGKDSIDHAPNGHDDVANAVAGVLTSMGIRKYKYIADLSWVSTVGDKLDPVQSRSAQMLSNILTLRGIR